VALDAEEHLPETLCNDAIDVAIQEFEEYNGNQSEGDM